MPGSQQHRHQSSTPLSPSCNVNGHDQQQRELAPHPAHEQLPRPPARFRGADREVGASYATERRGGEYPAASGVPVLRWPPVGRLRYRSAAAA